MDIGKKLRKLAKEARKEIKEGLSPCISRTEAEAYIEGGERMPMQLRELISMHTIGCVKCSERLNKVRERTFRAVTFTGGTIIVKEGEVHDNGEEVEVMLPPVGKYLIGLSISKSLDCISGIVTLIWPEGKGEPIRIREAVDVSVVLGRIARGSDMTEVNVEEMRTESGEFRFDIEIEDNSEYQLKIGSVPKALIGISFFRV